MLLINGTAKGIMVEDNDFCNNGRSAPVIEFKASTGAVKAKIAAQLHRLSVLFDELGAV